MEKTNKDIVVELSDRILASDSVTPQCLVLLAQKINLSVKSGGKKYFKVNEEIIREEIRIKLNRVGGNVGIGGIIEQGELLQNADTLNETVSAMSSDQLYEVLSEVCGLFQKFFNKHGFNPENPILHEVINKVEPPLAKEPEYGYAENELDPLCGEKAFTIERFRQDLEQFLEVKDISYLLSCICRGQPKLITTFGFKMPENLRLRFFAVMSAYFPMDSYFAVMLGKNAMAEGNRQMLKVALERMITYENDAKFLPTASAFARRMEDKELMKWVMGNMEKYIFSNQIHLNEYARLAYELDDREKMQKSLELMEDRSYEAPSLFTYSKIAIKIKDVERMHFASLIMEDHLDDRKFLKAYTLLAFSLMDEQALKKIYPRVAEITDESWFVCRYARIAQVLNDFDGMVRAKILLRNFLHEKPASKTYDILDSRIRSEIRNRQYERLQG